METMRVGRLLGLWLGQQMESSMVKPLARLTQDSETGTYSTAIRLGSLSVHLTPGFGKASPLLVTAKGCLRRGPVLG